MNNFTRNYHQWKNSKNFNTSFVTEIKSLSSVLWVCFETNTDKITSRQKRPRQRLFMGIRRRSSVIHLQAIAQAPNMRCMGDVGVLYCHADSVARCYLNEPSTVLVVEVVCWVVGASNKTSVAIPVRVAISCVHSIITVAPFDSKKTWKITFV